MEVIVVTSPKAYPSEADQIIHLFEGGLPTLLLRKPKWQSKEVETLINEIPKIYHRKVIVHGHYHLAMKYDLMGVHLHRRHRSAKWRNRWKRFWLKFKKPKLVICTTFNSLESLRDNRQRYDFAFLNSVFTAHSHYSRNEEAGLNMLRSIISQSQIPVFAQGGVTPEKIPIIQAAGFQGIGLSSAVWKNLEKKDPEDILSNFRAA